MLRLLKLELGKIFKPVITTTAILTVLTCILTCVLQRDYTVYFHIDAWEIGTEYIALLFPLFVTIPVCWQLYYERRDRFIVYTLSRISRQKYLSIKWAACALSGFCILFIPYVMSLLCALYVVTPANVLPPHDKYSHFLLTLYVQFPLIYGLLLSAWKALLGVLTMTFGFVLALFSRNIFVILTAPFVYVILENFILASLSSASLDLATYRFVLINSPGFISLDTGLQNLRYLAGIRGVIGDQEIRDAMKKVGLDPEDRTKVEHYSLGMKQKLGLAQAIMEGQDILVLDEPFNALDYKTYNDVKEIIRTLHAEGKTILMTSHNYEDIETLCDEIYAIEDGQLGTLPADEMKRRFRG